MVLKLGKTAIYVALKVTLDRLLESAHILDADARIGKLTNDSHGPLFLDMETDANRVASLMSDIRKEMRVPSPRVPGVLLGIHKDQPDKNHFTVLSFIREGNLNEMSVEELVATYKDTGAYVKVWFQPTVIPESV